MNDDFSIRDLFIWCIIPASIFLAFIALLLVTKINLTKEVKNGCSCGGQYEYEQTIGHAYSTGYIYKCNNCGRIIEISTPPNKILEREEN